MSNYLLSILKNFVKIENNRSIKHSIITGDFYIDLIKFDLKLNDNTNQYLNIGLKNGFIQLSFYLPVSRIVHGH